jgi:hypothetical protein
MTKPETEQPYASNQDQKANSRLWVCSVGLASLWYIGMLKEKSTPQYTSWTPENSPFRGRKSLEKKYKCNPDCQIFHILIRKSNYFTVFQWMDNKWPSTPINWITSKAKMSLSFVFHTAINSVFWTMHLLL